MRSDKIFSCDNFSVFGLDGDVSMIENSKTQFFFAENMLNWDFYDCENKKLAKYSFLDFGNRKVFLEKINFYENFYFSEICEWEYNEFQKYFSGKNGEKNSWNLENCEKIFKKYQNLTKNL